MQYLGVIIIDENLNFGNYINYITNKIENIYNKILTLHKNIFGFKNKDRQSESIIEYRSSIYFSKLNRKKKIKSLQRKIFIKCNLCLQNRILLFHEITGILPPDQQIEKINGINKLKMRNIDTLRGNKTNKS